MTSATSSPIVAEESTGRGCRFSLARIILLMALSSGVYWIYWMYRNRRHYKEYSGDHSTQPIWHGLTQLVPIYGFFRCHDHVASWGRATAGTGAPVTTAPAVVVSLAVLSTIFGGPDWFVPLWVQASGAAISLSCSCVAAGLFQHSLNTHWDWHDREYSSGASRNARFGTGEIICILVGVIIWSTSFLGVD